MSENLLLNRVRLVRPATSHTISERTLALFEIAKKKFSQLGKDGAWTKDPMHRFSSQVHTLTDPIMDWEGFKKLLQTRGTNFIIFDHGLLTIEPPKDLFFAQRSRNVFACHSDAMLPALPAWLGEGRVHDLYVSLNNNQELAEKINLESLQKILEII